MNIYDYEGFIFDLDGTLLDSMQLWDNIYSQVLSELNIVPTEDYLFKVNHLSLQDGADYTIDRFNITAINSLELKMIWENYSIESYTNEIKLKPYAYEFLTELAGKSKLLGIATALNEKLFFPCLVNNHISELFDSSTSIEEVTRSKEFPDIYLKESQKLNLTPNKIIVFEDSLTGIRSANKAGFTTIGVFDETASNQKDAIINESDKYIFSFDELL